MCVQCTVNVVEYTIQCTVLDLQYMIYSDQYSTVQCTVHSAVFLLERPGSRPGRVAICAGVEHSTALPSTALHYTAMHCI